jgi:hypothetical protein
MIEHLIEFLLARLAEEEAMAQKAADEVAELNGIIDREALPWRAWSRPAASLSSSGPIAEFIDNQTPWRVLADCEAKQMIMDDYLEAVRNQDDAAVSNLGWVLRRLGVPYAGHENYREEWLP